MLNQKLFCQNYILKGDCVGFLMVWPRWVMSEFRQLLSGETLSQPATDIIAFLRYEAIT